MWRVVVALVRDDRAANRARRLERRRTPRGSDPRCRRRRCVIASASSICAHRNAATISPGRYDEPRSTQVYLSTWPRKNWLRLVPFSRMISARSTNRGSLISSAPPSPRDDVLRLVEADSAARWPMPPSGRPS